MLLEGKKAIITGGTRGIGYAIACRFIEEGAAVTVFGSRQETADAAVEKLAAAYPDAEVWGRSCDLTSLEAVTEAFTQAATDMGGLDTVVNNAGISQRSPLLDYTAEEFAKVMDLNVVAVFNGHQAAAKIMTEAGHGGTITTTSSMVAKYGQPSGVGYPTSKFAVNGMVQSLSRELAPNGHSRQRRCPRRNQDRYGRQPARRGHQAHHRHYSARSHGRARGRCQRLRFPCERHVLLCHGRHPPRRRGSPLLKVESFGFEPQQSSTQKARCPHQPQAARLLLFGRNPYPDTPCYLPSSSWASSRA